LFSSSKGKGSNPFFVIFLMTQLFQLTKKKRFKKYNKNRSFNLLGNPQAKCVCLKLLTLSPKKPNSANRKVARVKMIQSGKFLTVRIVGEKHNLQQHSFILIKGGRTKDLIGINFKAIRGKYDLAGVVNRKTSRSLYGVKKY
jgi:small subunit ribosomal protein S12